MSFARSTTVSLFAFVLLTAGFMLVGCDSNDSDMEEEQSLRSVSYSLQAQSNDGAIPDGVSGTVTFWEVNPNQTLVTLELDDGATETSVAHPAHIHENSAGEGGGIAIYLTPIDGSGGEGTSARIVQQSYDTLVNFDGYVNIHESVANLGTVVAQGNIGANAEGDEGEGLDLVDDLETASYPLSANSNGGSVAPDGIGGTVTFQALTEDQTIVSIRLDVSGATGAEVAHPAHIHEGSAEQGGDIEYYLSPIDGTDEAASSSKLVEESYEDLIGFDGHVNVHESIANLGSVVSKGNIGANAEN
jgi:hypothetical protein